ncbi:hypothetical protein BDK51DRAFT_32295 [Blyttiomyces helicus]|uniref:Uncharacterized protein n=1 Tax=Blyttiomyces helicus TaxID=388810 RepID=A0A4P9WBI4_9FUNG|nr:hypothetical protein BDK51DRAFT_32295 [Blyttiomyces helicus]|eukprot:RKO88528.1 hypothetical protein BDK51DRAFT_32295 [Blyttiomyces helicus]
MYHTSDNSTALEAATEELLNDLAQVVTLAKDAQRESAAARDELVNLSTKAMEKMQKMATEAQNLVVVAKRLAERAVEEIHLLAGAKKILTHKTKLDLQAVTLARRAAQEEREAMEVQIGRDLEQVRAERKTVDELRETMDVVKQIQDTKTFFLPLQVKLNVGGEYFERAWIRSVPPMTPAFLHFSGENGRSNRFLSTGTGPFSATSSTTSVKIESCLNGALYVSSWSEAVQEKGRSLTCLRGKGGETRQPGCGALQIETPQSDHLHDCASFEMPHSRVPRFHRNLRPFSHLAQPASTGDERAQVITNHFRSNCHLLHQTRTEPSRYGTSETLPWFPAMLFSPPVSWQLYLAVPPVLGSFRFERVGQHGAKGRCHASLPSQSGVPTVQVFPNTTIWKKANQLRLTIGEYPQVLLTSASLKEDEKGSQTDANYAVAQHYTAFILHIHQPSAEPPVGPPSHFFRKDKVGKIRSTRRGPHGPYGDRGRRGAHFCPKRPTKGEGGEGEAGEDQEVQPDAPRISGKGYL